MAEKILKSIIFPGLEDTYIVPEQIRVDWNQNDSTAQDFIKNKPDEEDALALLVEVGFVEPAVAADGSIYTDENGNIYTL